MPNRNFLLVGDTVINLALVTDVDLAAVLCPPANEGELTSLESAVCIYLTASEGMGNQDGNKTGPRELAFWGQEAEALREFFESESIILGAAYPGAVAEE